MIVLSEALLPRQNMHIKTNNHNTFLLHQQAKLGYNTHVADTPRREAKFNIAGNFIFTYVQNN